MFTGSGRLCSPLSVATGLLKRATSARRLSVQPVRDFIASARQSLADPDWFTKMRAGAGDTIRRCEFTNCEALDEHHKQVTCKLWDREALDAPDATLAADGKRRLVAP